jgi:hypothetical protein
MLFLHILNSLIEKKENIYMLLAKSSETKKKLLKGHFSKTHMT